MPVWLREGYYVPDVIKGIVLAGGKSLRFGSDKALADFGGVTFLERSVSLLQSLVLDVTIISNPSRDYSFLGCRVENDHIADKGPLGGLFTALTLFSENALLILACDMPYVSKESLQRLIQAHGQIHQATIFKSRGPKLQPFPGIYESSLKEAVAASVTGTALSMQVFLKQIPTLQQVDQPDACDDLININTSDDL